MEPLSTLDINRILRANSVTDSYFIGTFPACITPTTEKKAYAFITNIDDHNMPGQHWNAWFIEGRRVTFFDSFGRYWDDDTLPGHYKDIAEPFERVTYSNTRLQGWDSFACGYFCIHFIYFKALGLDYEDFLNEYTNNFEKNDEIVFEFYNSIQ